jgi:hypothetical protein
LSGIWIAVSIFMPMLIASAKGALAREHSELASLQYDIPLGVVFLGGIGWWRLNAADPEPALRAH